MINSFKIVLFALLLTSGTVWSQPGNWENAGTMPLGISGASAVVIDSSIYVLGGYSDLLQSVVDWIYRFNPRTNTWDLAGHMKVKRANFIADKIGNKIYYLGGEVNTMMRPNGSLEVFDCNTGNSSVLDTNIRFLRNSPTGLIIDSVFYIIGGASLPGPVGNPYILEYNISAKTFTYSFQGPLGMREQQMSVFFNNRIYLFGGLSNTVTRDVFNYDILRHSLAPVFPNLLTPRSGGTAIKIPDSNQVVIMGGYDEFSPALSTAEIYQIMDSSHIMGHTLAAIHFRRTNFMAAYFDSCIYVFGGEIEHRQSVTAIERLRFITGIDDPVNNIPTGYKIEQNYPNPFNPTTNIGYYVSEKSAVSIRVYDMLGKEVAVLVDEDKPQGHYNVLFNGSNLSSGVYFYRITAVAEKGINIKDYIETRKMILLK
jgi:hypothetical protein